jgi:osmotically-inducible protein OsmY
MKIRSKPHVFGLSALLVVALVACDKQKPAETAGRQIDQGVDSAGRKVGEAIDKLGDKIEIQGAKTSVVIDDAEITTKVKAAIFAEPGLKTLQISVDTAKGVVTLSGSIDSPQSSDKARSLASGVAGVTAVENRLVMKPN